MIIGFNTDIEHDGVVYHVQTEDKGLNSPLILSLVYAGGAILAAKRSRYEDLIEAGFDEEALAQRVKRQHRLICAAINAGRIEDLKRMGVPRAEDLQTEVPAPADKIEVPPVTEIEAPSAEEIEVPFGEIEAPPLEEIEAPPIADMELVGVADDMELVSNADDYAALAESSPPALLEEIEVVRNADDYAPQVEDAETPPPPLQAEPEAPSISSPSKVESAYTVYDSRRQSPLGEAPEPEKSLVLNILDEQEYWAGQSVQLRILVEDRSGDTEKPLTGVAISVKILGTTFRPQIYTVKTERNGIAVVSAQLPKFTSGRAAILIRAVNNDRTAETRRVIHST